MALVPSWAWHLTVLVGAAVSVAVLLALARPGGRWGERVRTRLVLGLPLGTISAALFVLAVYLFVQNGLAHWAEPTRIPYRAWSYFSPLGLVVAPFAHGGPSHLVGNLVGTVTFGVLAEYAWNHFPAERGDSTFSSLRTNPFARALAFFVAVLAVGLLTSLFALGPVIGFSGVVFAFVGVALVRYPLGTVLVLVAGDVLGLLRRALQSPETTAQAGLRFVTPWFAGIAVQGHYLGLLLGVAVGAWLVRRRGVSPSSARLWFAALVLGVGQSLWALYAPVGDSQYVLFRALGVTILFVLAALVTASARASARPLVAHIDLSREEAATGLLVAVLLAVAIVAVPVNALTVGGTGTVPGESVEVRDYTVFYAEDVPHELVSAIDVPIGGDEQVNASGVIVASERRNIWWPEVTESELSSRENATVYLGGPGWRTPVYANRPAWRLLGGETAYRVTLRTDDGPERLAFTSDRATADGTFAGRNVSITPTESGFDVVVSREGETLDRAPVPSSPNGSVEAGGIRFERAEQDLFAAVDGTRVRVARAQDS